MMSYINEYIYVYIFIYIHTHTHTHMGFLGFFRVCVGFLDGT